MKILHLNAGNETGGGMYHILALLKELDKNQFILGVLEKGELLQRAKSEGIKTVYFSNNTRFSLPLIQKIKNYVKQQQISIIHTHGPRANVYASVLKRLIPFQWTVTVHSNPTMDFMEKGKYGDFLCRLNINALKKADKIIVISEPFRTCLNEFGIENERIVTALNGIKFQQDKKTYLKRTVLGFAEEDFIFLMVARLEQVKGHHIAFKAFANILDRFPNCKLVLVGDGSLKEELETLVKDLGIQENVSFMGHRDDVDCFYQLADITLLTSLSESFPLVLLESARAKTPVIATDVGGVNNLIVNNNLGWIIPPNRVDDLILAMEEAIHFHQIGRLDFMGESLYDYASRHFTVEKFANRIYDVYLSMLKVE
ncbi:glycosyltransferase family 4 protein [Oceanobacillus halophilus]|uniref:Glycosyltransferase family 1 protein n=1 Tax=Oceanobacillus halophilus TaxID=930130 RepID=A0A495A4G5_9BACI|nr:glycosyltransferase family 4 protein [Oceanobacillus halophilus]RKQ34302.1 glycosyltransferase family 1 protein [Oceanobacillus halophilus]